METSKSIGIPRIFAYAVSCTLLLGLFTLAGCGTLPPSNIRFKSETELGVSAVRLEWLKRCEGLAGPMPVNETGNLLQDYADMAAALRICIDRHNSFVDYIGPIVKKEQEGQP